ncbi:multifunctional CCA protein [Halomonas cupida]|uniref:Multifunctional CCA protein n=1 Tax=Halomonas cupida TaxID=44933 RepID=A0A1M7F7M8_9GAMM|nr:polynucleotide adenylyltransferase [Halomonas cupida]GEN23440.1 multifunctional CCA protein [Halomonas cupida]SHM00036.1 tRNA nucleotidyltransferase (CCA-adding enzyme) [Halomonas cupida]
MAVGNPCDGLEVYRVGGAVRDALLDWPVKDTDWVVVGATVDDMRQRGFRPVGRDFPVFLHPQTQEEYALARTERKSGHGYTGFVVHASPDVTLEEDLERRDLTINAMAQAADGRLIDPFSGQADLEARLLRHVSPAFVEDPLRVLRTARFLARYADLDFVVAAETRELMTRLASSGELAQLVAERVWTETEKALGEPRPDAFFRELAECGALAVLMPELEPALDDHLMRMKVLPEVGVELSRWRWARLVEALSSEARHQLSERLKLPRVYRELGEQLAHTRDLVVAGELPEATAVMHWLGAIDAWRRSERVVPLLALVEISSPALADRLGRAWRAALEVEPRQLVDEGFKGGQLGEELTQRRLQVIDAVFSQQ